MHYYLLCVAFSPLLFTYFGVSHTCGSGKCAGHVHGSVPRPKLSSWERKCSTTTLPGWGEPAGERSSSWSHHWNSIADAQKVFHVGRCSGAQDSQCSPTGMARCGHGSGVCLQPALDKPLLLHVPPNPRWVSCGSGSVILVFFSSSPLPPPPHV